jgi:hypothetical protein
MQILAFTIIIRPLAGNGEQVLLGDHLDLFGPEARHSERDAVAVLTELQDIEGRKPSSSRALVSSMLNRRSKPTVVRR